MVAMAQALSHGHMMIAWTILLASYFVFAVGRLPGTKIDRSAMAVIGAVLMFVFRVLAPAQAIASIDFATLVLLFSMMLIVASLHLAGFFQWVSHLLHRQFGPHYPNVDLLRVSLEKRKGGGKGRPPCTNTAPRPLLDVWLPGAAICFHQDDAGLGR